MNISRSVKRMAMIIFLAIVVILVSKSLLTKAAKNLSVAAEKKLQEKADKKNAAILAESVPIAESAYSGSDNAVIDTESAPVASEANTIAQ